MKAEDRAYCAGLFEGEGNINFDITNVKQRSPSSEITPRKSRTWRSVVS